MAIIPRMYNICNSILVFFHGIKFSCHYSILKKRFHNCLIPKNISSQKNQLGWIFERIFSMFKNYNKLFSVSCWKRSSRMKECRGKWKGQTQREKVRSPTSYLILGMIFKAYSYFTICQAPKQFFNLIFSHLIFFSSSSTCSIFKCYHNDDDDDNNRIIQSSRQ